MPTDAAVLSARPSPGSSPQPSFRPKSCAVFCQGISKVFPVFDEGVSWRVLFGFARPTRGVRALEEVSLVVPKGQFCAVLGRNGAGKSTLLRVLGGVYAPDAGRCEIDGDISGLFEFGAALGNMHLTGREYAVRWLEIYGVPRSQEAGMVDDIRQFSELGEAFDQPMRTYSAGMAARLYFATATSKRHEVFLIDELLSVGDEHFQAKCWGRMREVLSHGVSGVLVTHDWSAAMKICSVGQVLEKGRIIHTGPVDAVVRDYLRLRMPARTAARFLPSVDHAYSAASGQLAEFAFDVEILEKREVAFAFAVEAHRLGFGWEIVLLSNGIRVGDEPGLYRAFAKVPALPLAAGEYLLSVSLSAPLNGKTSAEVFDTRSWTLGNSLVLEVAGPRSPGIVSMPFQWRVARRSQ